MFWEEDEDKTLPYAVPEDVIDLVFSIKCKTLPLNHAWALSREILKHLPWIEGDPIAGIHQIHVAESNNGWMRPDDDEENALLYPSRRTKMTLRIPSEQLKATEELCGVTLDIDGHSLLIGSAKKKIFTNTSVISSRYVLGDPNESEDDFLAKAALELENNINFKVKKMLCGKTHSIKTPNGILTTRSLMIADLDSDTSIKIQQLGLGNRRELGCGLFLPHKGIKSLNAGE
ncbi:MAG TPA: type I-MYXAN CRISPR-associated protein Cas6/Cmx6 [Leucothrix sp.]|nr:type I-MYXAN CRISPR-associated protein Cas6/Cmx6 [Leucothrix sp.]